MLLTHRSVVSVLLITVLLAGCATVPQSKEGGAKEAPARDAGFQARRVVAGSANAAWHIARTVYENPVNRPVSTTTSLASLVLKSAGGLLRRVAIGTVQMPAMDGPVPPLSNAGPMDLAAFEKRLDRLTGTRLDTGKIQFLVDGDDYFRRLQSSIDSAEESIDIRTYIFDNDDFAVAVADQLKERSDDVRVRILLDGLGNMQAMHADPDSLPADHRMPMSMHAYIENGSNAKVRNITNPWFTGDHTKTTIIDKKLAFVGGMNIGREYRYDWHDLMMEVTGPVVDRLQFESDKAWARASAFGDVANFFAALRGEKHNAGNAGYPLRILQTKNFDSDIHKAQIAAIRSAKSYIFIENAYFSDDQTVYELARARRRGVDVRIIIPERGNHGPLNASNAVTINQLLKHGVRIYRYPGMSHVKAAIFDGWASVGSANFDKLSLKINKELNLATSDTATVDALIEQIFIPDFRTSSELHSPLELSVPTRLTEILVDELL